jgi:hypothetical protein
MKDSVRIAKFFAGVLVVLSSGRPLSAAWIETTQLTHAGGVSGDSFAASVAIDGDVAVVTRDADERAGMASVFVRSGGVWSEAAILMPSDSATGDGFGRSVAISGDTIAVGAFAGFIVSGQPGKIYVFVRPAGGWSGFLTENGVLESDVPGGGDAVLGTSVAVTDTYIAAGATNASGAPGKVFVFNRPLSGWSGVLVPSAVLIASDGVSGDALGQAVAASGNVIVAAAPGATVTGLDRAGKAYAFVEPSGGWSGQSFESAKLFPSDPAELAFFGWAAAIDGNTAVLTSVTMNDGTHMSQGYVFEKPAGGWNGILIESARLQSSPTCCLNAFGWSTSISGDRIVIGDPTGGISSNNTVYIFQRPKTGWTGTLSESDYLVGTDPTFLFGESVAISGNTLVVGEPSATVAGSIKQGEAHVFDWVVPRVTRTRFLVQGPIRVAPGVPVEFSFRVETVAKNPGPGGITGEVLVSDGAGHTCRSDVNVAGEGSCTLTFGNPGTYRVRAEYLGDLSLASSTSPAEPVLVGSPGGAP